MTDDNAKEVWWTVDEVAELLRMSRPTVIRLILQGELPGQKIGRQYRISSIDLSERLHRPVDLTELDPARRFTRRYPRSEQLVGA
jgi:excisionase family DNA binding protein